MRGAFFRASGLLFAAACAWGAAGRSQDQVEPAPAENPAREERPKPKEPPAWLPDLKRLDPRYDCLIDPKDKTVVLLGEVCFREGQLEMFACKTASKEHESVVAVRTRAFLVHAALLAVGAQSGGPASFDPKYSPPFGTEIEITVQYADAQGKPVSVPAKQWVLDRKTKKPMTYSWVFAGSGFFEDPDTKQRHYLAEDGTLICVSNFSSALIDVAGESSSENAHLSFEANTAVIPPLRTQVALILKPKLPLKPGQPPEGGAGKQER